MVELGLMRTVSDAQEVLQFLTTTGSVRRGAPTTASPYHARARVRGLLHQSLPRGLELLRMLNAGTPEYHPGHRDTVAIPSRLFDTTHSSIPRPVDPAKNDEYYCGNPHKRGFLIKVPIVVRVWDGAVLEIGVPFPGRRNDVLVPPLDRAHIYLCDLGYVGAPFPALCGVKRSRGVLTDRDKRYNSALSKWRCLAECVNGRLKVSFPRLRMWLGRDESHDVLRAAWVFGAVAHNVHIARDPMVRIGSTWDWLLVGTLPSSDPGRIPTMPGSGLVHKLPPLPDSDDDAV